MNLKTLLALLLGIAENEVLPLVIHNPKSQTVSAIVVADVNVVASAFGIPVQNLTVAATGSAS